MVLYLIFINKIDFESHDLFYKFLDLFTKTNSAKSNLISPNFEPDDMKLQNLVTSFDSNDSIEFPEAICDDFTNFSSMSKGIFYNRADAF